MQGAQQERISLSLKLQKELWSQNILPKIVQTWSSTLVWLFSSIYKCWCKTKEATVPCALPAQPPALSFLSYISANHITTKRQKPCYTFKKVSNKCLTHSVLSCVVCHNISIHSLHPWFTAWSLFGRLQGHTRAACHQEDNDSHAEDFGSLLCSQNDIMTPRYRTWKGKLRGRSFHPHALIMLLFMWICVSWLKSWIWKLSTRNESLYLFPLDVADQNNVPLVKK